MKTNIIIDGDFPSGKGDCKYHCSPTCHPAQVGPEWVYGCTHMAWPMNRAHDFVPIVTCSGNSYQCNLPKKLRGNYLSGRTRRKNNLEKKLIGIQQEIDETEKLKSHADI